MIGMVLAIMRFVEEKLVKALSKNSERYRDLQYSSIFIIYFKTIDL